MGYIILLIIPLVVVLQSDEIQMVKVNTFTVTDEKPEKGSNVIMKCNYTVSNDDGLQILVVSKDNVKLASCYILHGKMATCTLVPGASNHYMVINSTITEIEFKITNIQTSDNGTWFCGIQTDIENAISLHLVVYARPASIVLDGSLQGGDLQSEDVTLTCKTSNCVFPSPQVYQWFYKSMNLPWLFYINSTATQSQSTCQHNEKIYSSTLSLARNTVWPLPPSNVETTVQFQCRLVFPTLELPLRSIQSGDVLYAVRVTSVTLKDGTETPASSDTVEVIAGSSKKLTCTTNTSRPVATIVWYIGTTVKQRGTGTFYMYNPLYVDNNKQIYCKAFNIQSEANAVSSYRPKLYVKVIVTSVTILDGTVSPNSDDVIELTENQQKTLTCRTGDSNPPATIEWYINGQRKQTGTNVNYVFTPTNSDHDKRIHCKAYNIQPIEEAVASFNPKLYVKVLASTPSLTNWTSGSPEFFSEEQVSLNCMSTPTRPAATVRWKKGTSPLTNIQNVESTDSAGLVTVMSTVTFTPQKSDNRKVISCETHITNQISQNAHQSISVWWPPSIPSISTSFPWREGQQGKQLNCSTSDNGNPMADVSWISHVGTPVSDMLKLPVLTQYYNGVNVSCQLSNKYTQRMNARIKSKIIQLDIQYKPDIFIKIDNVERYRIVKNEGQSLTALCTAEGNPSPTVNWQGMVPGSTKLEFIDIDRNNHGVYTCFAKATSTAFPSYDFSNETTLDVTVNYAPNVTVELSNADLVENATMQVKCNAVGRPDNYVFTSMVQTWGGIQIPNSHKPVDGIIDIRNLKLEDSGTYTCVVNNGIHDRNQQLDQVGKKNIMVKVSPKVLLDGSNKFTGAVKTSVNITVPFYSYPEIRFVKFKLDNGSEITNSSKYEVSYKKHNVTSKFYGQAVELDGYIAVLHIKDEEVSDFRNYTLVLQNDIGPEKEWILEHISEDIPSPPINFIITSIVAGVATFSFTGGFNGGSLQTFIVETTVYGTENWMEQVRFNETDKGFLTDKRLEFRFNVTGLRPNKYNIRILAQNSIGRIGEADAVITEFTIPSDGDLSTQSPIAAIIGGTVAALVVIAIVGVFVIVRRRKLKGKDGRSAVLRGQMNGNDNESSDDEVMTENLAYVSADEVNKAEKLNATPENLYAQPQKKKKKVIPESGDLYSSVKKTKTEDPGSIYSMPDKKDIRNQKKENKKCKDDRKGRNKQKSKQEDVYENASELTAVTGKRREDTFDKNIYENPEESKPAKKNVNKDGLIYADLTFNDQPKGQKKLVIHGLDSMTEYVQVDFTKKADPLPDSDEETNPPSK